MASSPVLLDHRPACQHLVQTAQTIGQDQRLALDTGLLITVRVHPGRMQLILSRAGALVGLAEAGTIRGWCNVPETAQRDPAKPFTQKQQHGHYWVAWTWDRVQATLDGR